MHIMNILGHLSGNSTENLTFCNIHKHVLLSLNAEHKWFPLKSSKHCLIFYSLTRNEKATKTHKQNNFAKLCFIWIMWVCLHNYTPLRVRIITLQKVQTNCQWFWNLSFNSTSYMVCLNFPHVDACQFRHMNFPMHAWWWCHWGSQFPLFSFRSHCQVSESLHAQPVKIVVDFCCFHVACSL